MARKHSLLPTLVIALTLGFAASPMLAQTLSDAERAQESLRTFTETVAAAKREVTIAPADPVRFPDSWYPPEGRPETLAPITGKPYSAVEVDTDRDKGPDRVTFNEYEQRTVKMRDSAGRERTESIFGRGTVDGVAYKSKSIQVSDPVAHCVFHWTVRVGPSDLPDEEKLAFVECGARKWTTIAFDDQADLMASVAIMMPGSDSERIEAVKGEMDGLEYVGVRVIHLPKPGEDTKVWGLETWYSPELHVQLRQFGVDQNGIKLKTDTESSLTEIKRAEPDPALFYPPDTYKIFTEQEYKNLIKQTIEARP